MIPDEMYDLAFALKQAKPWKKLWDSQIFALRHSDKTIGYCCLMGKAGQHTALAVYPGIEGMISFRLMCVDRDDLNEVEQQEMALSQRCVMVSYQNKDALHPKEQDEVAAYCARRGRRLGGQKAYPQFERFRPHYCPWYIEDKSDLLHMREGLEAALEVSRQLEMHTALELGFTSGEPFDRMIPLLTKTKTGFQWSSMILPGYVAPTYPTGVIQDELALARLGKKKKKGPSQWACNLFMHIDPMVDEPTENGYVTDPTTSPFYPYLLIIVENKSGMIIASQIAQNPEDYTEDFAQRVLKTAEAAGKPSQILVENERSQAFFERIAEQLGAKLVRKQSIPLLDEAMEGYFASFSQPESDAMEEDDDNAEMEQLSCLVDNPSALRALPDPMLAYLLQLASTGILTKKQIENIQKERERRKM